MTCDKECINIIKKRKKGIVRRVYNKKDPFGSNPFIFVQHPKGNYTQHFVVQDGDKIIDPFLNGLEIPIDRYKKLYKNFEEIKIV